MVFSYLVHLVILEFVGCIHVPDEIYPKKSAVTAAHRDIQTTKQFSLTSDATTFSNENYFPDVIYPTSILDVAQPFFYRVNAQDLVLGPFSDDVKSSYKYLTSNTGKSKNINNQIMKNMSQSQENLESGTENEENTCSNHSSKEHEDNEELIVSKEHEDNEELLSDENVNNIIEEIFIVNRHNISISTFTPDNQTNSFTDADKNISCSHVKNVLKEISDKVNILDLEGIKMPAEENVNEVYKIILDLKRQESNEDNNVTWSSELNLTKKHNETSLGKEFEPIDLTNQNIFLDNQNLTSNKVVVIDLNETLPPLPVGCFESGNVTSNILITPTEEKILLSLEESLHTISNINTSNDNYAIGNSETDLYPDGLPISLENDNYSNYDSNCTNVYNDNPRAQDENEEFFLDMIISLASICETDDITISSNKDSETNFMEIPIIDQTNNIPQFKFPENCTM